MTNVTIRNASKSYGGTPVLRNVDIQVEPGEFVVLVGPSGCGKSTLLRSIAGLETIDGGEIEISGQVVNDILPKDRNIAMVFQSYALYPHMTVEENMGFALKLKGVAPAVARAEIAKAAAILGLSDLLGRYPRQLSGGQRQRVAMGRAIVRQPDVFLFDEPLSNLDSKLRVQMRSEIKLLHQRLKSTTIYVTHDQIEAMTMADRIVVMRGGVVEQVGAPLELFDRPASVFVAGFIGSPSMNLIEGRMVDGAFQIASGTRFPIAANFRTSCDRVVYGVRPEDLAVVEDGIPATVEVVEPMGSESLLILDVGRQPLQMLCRYRVSHQPGQKIHVGLDPQNVHLFDGDTGQRLN